MPKSIPSLSSQQMEQILNSCGCRYYREGEGDHRLFIRDFEGKKRIGPLDRGAKELSPVYGLHLLRQFGFSDEDIGKIYSTNENY